MNTRLIRPIAAFAILAFVATAAPPAEARGKSRSAKTTKPGFLGAFTKAHQNLLVVFGVVPHLRAALQSATITNLSEMVKERLGEDAVEMRQTVLSELNSLAPKLPAEVAFGFTDKGVDNLGRLVSVAFMSALAAEAIEQKDDAILAKAHDVLTSKLKGGGFAGFSVYGRVHSEDMAKGLMGMISAEARTNQGKNPAVEIDVEDDAVGFVFHVGKALSDADAQSALVSLDVIPDAGHPATGALVGAMRSIKQEIWLDRLGAGLRLTFGPRLKRSRPLRAKKLGRSFRAASQDILWTRWTAKPWAKLAKGFERAVAPFRDSSTWQAMMKSLDTDPDSFGFEQYATAFQRGDLGKKGDSRLWVEDGALRNVAYADGMKKMQPLGKSALLSLLPGSATIIQAETVLSIDLAFSTLSTILNRGLSPVLGGDDKQKIGTLIETLEADISKAASDVFVPGAAFVVTWGGDIDTIKVVRTREDGTQKRLDGSRLPNYGVAMAFPLATGADGLAFGAKVLATAGSVMCTKSGGNMAKDAKFAVPTKLGLGTPTFAVPWSAMTACQIGKSTTQVEVTGDLLLHAFQLGDVLILSSSKALSVQIASTYAGARSAYRLPKPVKGQRGKLVGFGDLDGEALGAWIGSFAQWAERVQYMGPNGSVISDETRSELVSGIHLAADALRLLGDVSWTSTASGRTLSIESRISFR